MEHNVAGDHTAAAEMVRISGQRGVPVIVIDGQVVVGFDRPRLEQLLARAQKPEVLELGAAITSAAAYAQKHGLQLPEGAYVGNVKSGSLAARAGLRAGDVIVGLAGRPVHSDRDVEAMLASLRGQRFTLSYWRDGVTKTVEIG